MAVLKCKMCGGDLEVQEGMSVLECDYCGTSQTVPTVKDENLQGLYNRANILRMKSEFDKAEAIYEKILQVKEDEAEAHWGIVLCQYGIEYVEDPQTFKRIPTCHRASYEAIASNADYEAALTYADAVQRAMYEKEAQVIDEIQKGILAISQKEEPYDVFICYKETDANGERTIDSTIANEIYYQLTQEGFKVFYAAITLEEKLGSEYEPFIFSALNTAQVMLSIGTKPEYFNAVWVKNEWSRFLKLMKKDRSKMLIPCYRDMDAYELPEEFAHLQAQNMSKIGFINDLVRGIKKVMQKEETVNETIITSQSSANTAPLLERAFMFLEDKDWDSADEYCEKVLDVEPKNAQAYLGKLMAEHRIDRQENLRQSTSSFDASNNYQKILRFGDSVLVKSIREDNEFIINRNKESIYQRSLDMMARAQSEDEFIKVSDLFGKIVDYKDANALKLDCLNKAENARQKVLYEQALVLVGEDTIECIERAIRIFDSILTFEDSERKIEECKIRIGEIRKDQIYAEATSSAATTNVFIMKESVKKLETIIDWRDARQKIAEYRECIEENEKLDAIRNECGEQITAIEEQIRQLRKRRNECYDDYASLGLFSGKEKKRLEEELEQIAGKVKALEQEKSEVEKKQSDLLRKAKLG